MALPRVAMFLGVFMFFPSVTDFLLLSTGFGTKWPWSIEASTFRVIGSRADRYVVAGLRLCYHGTLQVDGLICSRRPGDIGARGQRH
jgi:hypothetical protein